MEENMASGEMIEESMASGGTIEENMASGEMITGKAERKSRRCSCNEWSRARLSDVAKTTHYTRKKYAMTQHRQTRHRNTE